ncbi:MULTISPECIES: hypothetical protein [Sulfolobaceae]|uniref:hypothetical protein n=1 Tax=Sulfolobaceae TaxID=118883 RepID=UPI00117CCA7A|nr:MULTISPECIES: hypothetical protein [unclassified Sulfolobus]
MLIIVSIILSSTLVNNSATLNVRISSPFPVAVMLITNQGVDIASENESFVISGNVTVSVTVISPYSTKVFINGVERNAVNLSLGNNTSYNLSIYVIPIYSYLLVKNIGKGYVDVEFPNGSVIRISNSTIIKTYNGSTLLLQAEGNLVKWSNGETSNVILYDVNGNSSIIAYFSNSSFVNPEVPKSYTYTNYTDIALSLVAVGFFLLYKIYSKKEQDTNA